VIAHESPFTSDEKTSLLLQDSVDKNQFFSDQEDRQILGKGKTFLQKAILSALNVHRYDNNSRDAQNKCSKIRFESSRNREKYH